MRAVSVRRLAVVLAASIGLTAGAAEAQNPGAASRPVTFSKDVAPILQRACQNCHRPGMMAPMNPGIRASLEHQIPKAKGHQFIDLISYLAQEHCWEEDPNC